MVSIDTAFLLYRLSGWSVCLFVAAVICAKTNEQIELPVAFGVWTLVLAAQILRGMGTCLVVDMLKVIHDRATRGGAALAPVGLL